MGSFQYLQWLYLQAQSTTIGGYEKAIGKFDICQTRDCQRWNYKPCQKLTENYDFSNTTEYTAASQQFHTQHINSYHSNAHNKNRNCCKFHRGDLQHFSFTNSRDCGGTNMFIPGAKSSAYKVRGVVTVKSDSCIFCSSWQHTMSLKYINPKSDFFHFGIGSTGKKKIMRLIYSIYEKESDAFCDGQ